MKRPLVLASFLLAGLFSFLAAFVNSLPADEFVLSGFQVTVVVAKTLSALAIAFLAYGLYLFTSRFVVARFADRRRQHDIRNVVRLAFILFALVSAFAIITEQWVGLLVSLGVVGFAITFALQQPLFSFIGWFYIMVKRPYQVGDRVEIEGSKGDVVAVDFFITTLWEINGELVSSNQPSGRIITLPNSVVLSSHVHNYSWEGFPHVWNELSVQVAFETDMDFAESLLTEVADDYLGDEMAEHIANYRRKLAETPVELEVRDRPTVNIRQQESWVDLRLRYLTHPRQGQRVKNELYKRILVAFNEHPERIKFPVGRNR
ncbi:mechanosensitive ion channel family protein [Haladaptatus sp. DYSN1]|uniref:mechanosensitive ion channel family protein n=1 Tax=unclassified Haladaptatus TaxID=2622732 RepID=UPI002404A8C9|nr:mechanosensitive ion channel family protein [Haladaptatus sp. DYSN1]